MRDHPTYARAILGALGDDSSALLRMALATATTHHKRWDGAGYPSGLRAEAIPLPGRIVAVADAYCELTSPRSRRPASPGHALAAIDGERGAAYDPRVVGALRDTIAEAP